MSELSVREATTADAAALARTYRNAYRENRELGFPMNAESATADEVGAWIRNDRVFVATLDGAVVGGVRLEATDGDRAKLSRLAVRDDCKGEGISGRLLTHAETAARQAGHERIWLTTPGNHPFLPGLYRRRGYDRTGDYPLEYRDYDEIVMEKRLE